GARGRGFGVCRGGAGGGGAGGMVGGGRAEPVPQHPEEGRLGIRGLDGSAAPVDGQDVGRHSPGGFKRIRGSRVAERGRKDESRGRFLLRRASDGHGHQVGGLPPPPAPPPPPPPTPTPPPPPLPPP